MEKAYDQTYPEGTKLEPPGSYIPQRRFYFPKPKQAFKHERVITLKIVAAERRVVIET